MRLLHVPFQRVFWSQSFDFCGKPDTTHNVPNLAEGSFPEGISSSTEGTEVSGVAGYATGNDCTLAY